MDERVTLPAGSVLSSTTWRTSGRAPASDDAFDPDRWLGLDRRDAHYIPFGVTANRPCPARRLAPVMMRAVTREVLSRFALASTVSHTRSLPTAGRAIWSRPERRHRALSGCG